MAVVVNTNIPSISASRILTNNRKDLELAMERLSSGKRINSAKDDAAGGAVAAKLRADIGSISQAIRNTNDGISLINTYDGAASEIESILIRMRQLATQAKTGTYADADMALASKEYDQLKSEIRRIAQVTTFNRVVVGNGSGTAETVTFSLFAGSDPTKDGNSIKSSADTLDLNSISTPVRSAILLQRRLRRRMSVVSARLPRRRPAQRAQRPAVSGVADRSRPLRVMPPPRSIRLIRR